MEWLSSFAGSSGLPALITVLLIVLIVLFAVKMGWVSFKGHGLEIGAADKEIKIRNMQQLYAKSLFEGTIESLPKECEYYHKRFVIGQCLDEIERMIRENHISCDDTYIETEFLIVYSIVLKYTILDYFRKQEFKDYLYDLISKLIKQLVKIRKQYSQ
jgi:hypothetical protein